MKKQPPIPTVELAARLLRGGRIDEAAEMCRKILKRRREAGAHRILGWIAATRGRIDEAVQHYEKAIKLRPDVADYRYALAKVYTQDGRFDDAIAVYDRVLARDPAHAGSLAGKAEVLDRLGDRDAARAVLEPLVGRGAEDAEMAAIYARLLRLAGDPAASADLVQRHLDDPRTPGPERRLLLFELGDACTKLKEHDRSFAAYRRANESLTHPFDITSRQRLFDRIIDVFSAKRVAARPRSTIDSELPVFIVGMPRSGSTLVEQIIAAHPRAYGAGEINDLSRAIRRIPEEIRSKRAFPEFADDLDRAMLDRIGHRFLGRLRQFDRTADRIADKHLENYVQLGLIAMLFPKARVVHCRRDPMSVCFSIYTLPLSPPGHPYSTDLRNLGLQYREYDRLMDHWRETLNIPMLEIQYEELVADQESWSRTLIDFCGLEWDDACLRFHASGRGVATASFDQVRQPIYRSALKRYEPFDGHLGPLKDALGIDGAS
ncbi:MAG: tetratricopeptide repeat protein [Planctomycetes bacterium]|nr:tetratricopeptide repeat protein [Planctomycetota bacterium]